MKNSQKGFVATLLLIVGAVLLVGGGMYIYKQLNRPFVENSVVQSTSTAQAPTSPVSDWHTYHNTKYGFTITFPDSWEGYRVRESSDGVWFGIKDQDQVFGVAVYTKQEWNNVQQEAAQSGGPFPGPEDIIAENSNYVFTPISAQDFSDSVIELARIRHTILATFTFK